MEAEARPRDPIGEEGGRVGAGLDQAEEARRAAREVEGSVVEVGGAGERSRVAVGRETGGERKGRGR